MAVKSSRRNLEEKQPLASTEHVDDNDGSLLSSTFQYETTSDDESINSKLAPKDDDSAEEVHEMPNMLSLPYFGILVNYFVLGLVYGFMTGLSFPVFSGILGLPSPRVKSCISSINLAWSLKVFLSNISDTKPIFGYSRKYYAFLGWFFSGLVMLLTVFIVGQPDDETSPMLVTCLFALITLCYVMGDVAIDACVVTLALREPIEKRGTLQATIYFVRYCAMILSGLVISFGFNSHEYGGNFDFGIKLPHYIAVLAGLAFVSLFFFYNLKDEPNQPTRSYLENFKAMYDRLKLVVVSRIMLFSFFVHLFAYVSNTAIVDVQRQLCDVTPIYDATVNQILSYVAMSTAIYFTRRYLLNVSWHKILATCIILMAFGVYIPAILIDFNIVRHPAFATLSSLIPTLIQGIFFIVCALSAVLIAEPGCEGITFGLLTTVNNITNPLTVLLSTNILRFFEIYGPDGTTLLDTASSRFELFKLDTTIFCLQLCALITLLLLPRQKRELSAALKAGKREPVWAKVVVIGFIVCFIYSLLGNFAQGSETTSCLVIFGGKGCHQ